MQCTRTLGCFSQGKQAAIVWCYPVVVFLFLWCFLVSVPPAVRPTLLWQNGYGILINFDWVSQLCCIWLSLGKASQIFHGKNSHWDNNVKKTKINSRWKWSDDVQVVAVTLWPRASCGISTPSPSMSLMMKPWWPSSAASWSGTSLQSMLCLCLLCKCVCMFLQKRRQCEFWNVNVFSPQTDNSHTLFHEYLSTAKAKRNETGMS